MSRFWIVHNKAIVECKIRRITWPHFAIRQKLASSGIIRVWIYEKVGRVIWLESELNTCILDEYGEYSTQYSTRYSTRPRITWPRFIIFTNRDRLNLGYKALIFASKTKLKSVPPFTEILNKYLIIWKTVVQVERRACIFLEKKIIIWMIPKLHSKTRHLSGFWKVETILDAILDLTIQKLEIFVWFLIGMDHFWRHFGFYHSKSDLQKSSFWKVTFWIPIVVDCGMKKSDKLM